MQYDRDLVITMRDIRAAKQCSRGARDFFLKNKLDWQDFLKNGIKCGIIIDLDDAMAIQVVRAAHERK